VVCPAAGRHLERRVRVQQHGGQGARGRPAGQHASAQQHWRVPGRQRLAAHYAHACRQV
jgi:hypothetical protein